MDLSNTAWAQRGLTNRLSGYAFGAVTRIRPIIIITFGTATVVVHNGIFFGADTGVGYQRSQYCYSGAVPRYCYIWYHNQTIALQMVTVLKSIVLHLVPDQKIVLHLMP